jgi:hypothetical protein
MEADFSNVNWIESQECRYFLVYHSDVSEQWAPWDNQLDFTYLPMLLTDAG